MPLPEPSFVVARGVFELPNPSPRTPDQDDVLIAALHDAFPNLAARQMLPPGLPASIPYLALQSTASRLAVSAVGSELETRFYGDYVHDATRCLDYLGAKLQATLRGWAALERQPSFLGVLLTMNFPFGAGDPTAAQFLSEHHLREALDPGILQDTQIRVAVRLDDVHFLTLQLSNYELRTYERPVFSGQQILQVRPWEGAIDERGIEMTVDINNKHALIERQGDYRIDEAEVERTISLMRRAVERLPDQFVENAALDIASLSLEQA